AYPPPSFPSSGLGTPAWRSSGFAPAPTQGRGVRSRTSRTRVTKLEVRNQGEAIRSAVARGLINALAPIRHLRPAGVPGRRPGGDAPARFAGLGALAGRRPGRRRRPGPARRLPPPPGGRAPRRRRGAAPAGGG